MVKKLYKFVFLLSFFLLLGCQDIIECVINTHPQLPDNGFKMGRVEHFYSDLIRAEINNSPHDNGYFYDFTVHGDIPEGLDVYIEYRNLIIEGIPRERGTFHFRISLFVERDYDYFYDCEAELNNCDGLCDDYTSQDYVIEII